MSKLSVEDFLPDPVMDQVSFAKVADIIGDGVQLLIDGESVPTKKYYRHYKSYTPEVGDRVHFIRVSGTLLVTGAIA